jgi:hypothetical protein
MKRIHGGFPQKMLVNFFTMDKTFLLQMQRQFH